MQSLRRHNELDSLEDQEPPRKKVRKGTRSCWECKHRKVRCHFATDGDSTCRECMSRGTSCRNQSLPEPEKESDRSNLNERMARMENLLEKVLNKLEVIEGDATRSQEFATSLGSPEPGTPVHDNAPALSLFQNELLGGRQDHTARLQATTFRNTTERNKNNLRQNLLGMMPPNDVTFVRLHQYSSCWRLLRIQCFQDQESSLLPIPPSELPTSHPTMIAKCLLWVALSVQQLPARCDLIDLEYLQLPYPPTKLIEQYMAATSNSKDFDDAMLSSLDGLECLVLQGIIHNNEGRLRSAWMSYRRAINIAQIIGLHSRIPISGRTSKLESRAKVIWNHIIHGDRYLSLMLGMHHGIGDAALVPEDPRIQTPNSVTMNALCRIAGSLIERNQKFRDIDPVMVRMTQNIDIDLRKIDPELTKSQLVDRFGGKSSERPGVYTKLMTSLWFHQLTAWLHLPFLFKSSIPGPYEYNRTSCLKASQEMITCYTGIRDLTLGSFCCRSLDFQAFTAAVTLVLDMLSSNGSQDYREQDCARLNLVMFSLREHKGREHGDKVASRGLVALETLVAILVENQPVYSKFLKAPTLQGAEQGRIKIEIPYFGTFLLHRNADKDGERLLNQTAIEQPACENTLSAAQYNTASNRADQTAEEADTVINMNEDPWTFDIDLTTIPPFLSDFGDDWDLGL
ncbi:hypothetical protein N7481_007516 [Penicillium waksmanii]|uniref:uncharacterized protein n=1 Tax=Penicillium waksmanii TaxID=69791 RepID=UPI0025474011|nr:uncharacterized protein N7481_007516 [Penicillium waksmanii]KAJ5980218.1 hypothetical protein N7481_007516 [Penicillium waksmanii]